MSSNKRGLLIDTQWCTGCHTCETACQMEHELPVGQFGIKVAEIGPWSYESGGKKKWQFGYMPTPTDQCDGCAARVSKGKLPTCVHHCQAKCLTYGNLDELASQLQPGTKMTLVAL